VLRLLIDFYLSESGISWKDRCNALPRRRCCLLSSVISLYFYFNESWWCLLINRYIYSGKIVMSDSCEKIPFDKQCGFFHA